MASSLNRDDFETAFLECPICLSRYKNPKILACYHSFCEHCLQSIVDNNFGRLHCPLDRKQQNIPPGGVPALPNSAYLQGLIDYFDSGRHSIQSSSTSPKCTGCDKNSSHHCIECDDHLCKLCANAHGKLSLTKTHKLITIGEYQTTFAKESPFMRPIICPRHKGNQIKLYCESCSLPICVECTIFDHPRPDHKFATLEDVAQLKKSELSELKIKLERSMSKLQKGQRDCLVHLQTLEGEKDTAKNNLWARYNQHVKHLKRQANYLEDEITQIYLQEQRPLQEKQQDIKSLMMQANKTMTFTEQFLAESNDVGFLWLQAQARENIIQMTRKLECLYIRTPGPIKFESNEEFLSSVTTDQIGRIISAPEKPFILTWNLLGKKPKVPKLTFIRKWSGAGYGPLAISPVTNNIISVDIDERSLQVRSMRGDRLHKIPLPFHYSAITPSNGMAIDDDGVIYLIASHGEKTSRVYYCPEYGKCFKVFHSTHITAPRHISMMANNQMCISQPKHKKATVLTTEGKYIRTIKTPNMSQNSCVALGVTTKETIFYSNCSCGKDDYIYEIRVNDGENEVQINHTVVDNFAVDNRNNVFMRFYHLKPFELHVYQDDGELLAKLNVSCGAIAIKPYTIQKQVLITSYDNEMFVYHLTYEE